MSATLKLSQLWKAAKSGVCELPAGETIIVDQELKVHGSGIFIGQAKKYLGQPRPVLRFTPGYSGMPTKFDVGALGLQSKFALTLGGDCTVSHVELEGTPNAKLVLADRGVVNVIGCFSRHGTSGVGDMGGADFTYFEDCGGYAAGNIIYTGHGAHNGLLKWRRLNMLGGMTYEHGIRCHRLDQIDGDGGMIDGSGSLHGKDVLTIHELYKGGTIANMHFKGWATIGGLLPQSPGDNKSAVVNNLTFTKVSFEPCIRADKDKNFGKPNGARLYFLAGVNNFKWDGGLVTSPNERTLLILTNDGASSARKHPTGEIRNVIGAGPGKFIGGNAARGFAIGGRGNVFNGKSV